MSPIIATILLVAITVVLAAVLYVLISGLTRGPGNTPIGSAFGMASPTLTQGGQDCKYTDYCYTVQIASASTGLNWNNIQFTVHTASGNPATVTFGNSGIVTIVGPTGTNATSTVAGCSIGVTCTGTGAVSTGEVIVVDFGTTSPSGAGYILIANGEGSYSSSTSVTLP